MYASHLCNLIVRLLKVFNIFLTCFEQNEQVDVLLSKNQLLHT